MYTRTLNTEQTLAFYGECGYKFASEKVFRLSELEEETMYLLPTTGESDHIRPNFHRKKMREL